MEPPVVAFADAAALRAWLEQQPADSVGAWVRVAKAGSGIPAGLATLGPSTE